LPQCAVRDSYEMCNAQTWLAHIDTKHHHFRSAAQYRKSMDELESNKYGYELARLLESKQIAKKGFEIARYGCVSNSVLDDIKVSNYILPFKE
jgi:programmed cell death 6-interacting protein